MASLESLFRAACEAGDLPLAKRLFSSSSLDPNSGEETFHRSAFLLSCQSGNHELVQFLLKDPRISVNLPNLFRETPFSLACQAGDLELVRLLSFDPRIDVTLPNLDEEPPFSLACAANHHEVVRFLLADRRIDPSLPDCEGITPLFTACEHSSLESLSLLLQDLRVDPNRANDHGATPLWIAVRQGHLAAVKMLLASGRLSDLRISEGDFRGKRRDEIFLLLRTFQADPWPVIWQLRSELGMFDEMAASYFSLIILLCDGFFTLKVEAE